MNTWTIRIEVGRELIRIVVKDKSEDEILRAKLPRKLAQREALSRLIDALSAWCGEPLCAVISVVGLVRPTCDWARYDADFDLQVSERVRFVFGVHGRRQLHLVTLDESRGAP